LIDVGIAVLYHAPRIRMAIGRSLEVTDVRAVDAPTAALDGAPAGALTAAGADA
jgi:hypothetical protein